MQRSIEFELLIPLHYQKSRHRVSWTQPCLKCGGFPSEGGGGRHQPHVQETLTGKRFLAGALQHCSQDAADTCKHVLFGGLFASASQNCIWSVPASVFATLYSKVSRRFKETLACTCFVEGCFPGHHRRAENACPQAFSRSCFEPHRGFPRKHWPASVLRRFVSQCITGMRGTLACKRFVESLFPHTVLANYPCLYVFLLLANSEHRTNAVIWCEIL